MLWGLGEEMQLHPALGQARGQEKATSTKTSSQLTSIQTAPCHCDSISNQSHYFCLTLSECTNAHNGHNVIYL